MGGDMYVQSFVRSIRTESGFVRTQSGISSPESDGARPRERTKFRTQSGFPQTQAECSTPIPKSFVLNPEYSGPDPKYSMTQSGILHNYFGLAWDYFGLSPE